MLSLDDPAWQSLKGVCGADIPALLRRVATFPPEGDPSAPYEELWTELCHQSTTCPASYAAVPHMVEFILSAPDRTPWTVLLVVLSIELSRQGIDGPGLPVPTALSLPYHRAIDRLPEVVSRIARHPMDEHMACCAAAALLVKGHAALAEILLFLEPEALAKFNEWREENI